MRVVWRKSAELMRQLGAFEVVSSLCLILLFLHCDFTTVAIVLPTTLLSAHILIMAAKKQHPGTIGLASHFLRISKSLVLDSTFSSATDV